MRSATRAVSSVVTQLPVLILGQAVVGGPRLGPEQLPDSAVVHGVRRLAQLLVEIRVPGG